MFSRYKNYFYGSALSSSDIRATNAYGWGFQFKKNSPQNLLIKYLGVFHIGARIRARLLCSILDSVDYSKSELFDAGCGMGLTSLFLSNRFKNVLGVDIDKGKIKEAKMLAKDNRFGNITFKDADLLENKFTQKKFDVVVCFEVIEHVKSDEKLIKTLSRRVKDNGKIIMSFPSNSFISAIAQKSLQHEKVGYLPSDIRKIAKKNNLRIKKELPFGKSYLAQFIIAFDFFTRKTFPFVSPILFPILYPFVVLDIKLPVMGTPRGYMLILEKNK